MNFLLNESLASELWFDNDNLWLALTDGRQISVPLSYFPRLLRATDKQRSDYVISGGGKGLHWDEIDEDISVAGLLLGTGTGFHSGNHVYPADNYISYQAAQAAGGEPAREVFDKGGGDYKPEDSEYNEGKREDKR